MTKFNDLEDRIEFEGTRLVNANRKGFCAWCGSKTLWFDMNMRLFLCSEECVRNQWGQYFETLVDSSKIK